MADASGNQDVNLKEVACDILCEFLEVAIHQILHVRELYPPGIFERRKKYGIPVFMSKHPAVNKYITDVITGLQPVLKTNEVQSVAVVILSPNGEPLERFKFEIIRPNDSGLSCNDIYLTKLEQNLRAFVLRINTCDALLKKVPKDSSFTVLAYTTGSATMDLEDSQFLQGFPWIEADEGLQRMRDPVLTPLKTLNSDLFMMQLYVEESSLKPSTVT